MTQTQADQAEAGAEDAQAPPFALITGSGKRLGRAIALKLAAAGCDVAIHYNASKAEAENVAHEIRRIGRASVTVGFDIGDDDAIDAGFDKIAGAMGRAPDVLVNSASIYEDDDIRTVTRDALARHMDANLFGPVQLARKLVEASSPETRGLIVNILDHRLWAPRADHLSYGLSKYALHGFTEMMARTLAPRFRVCGVAPGYTLPDVDAESAEHHDAHKDATPLQRGPAPDDIAGACAYLLTAPAVTGQTLIVDGGAFMRPAKGDAAFEA
ncbi:MAG: SDR family oxidoreductase [Hyphomonadaceae bacterium]